MPINHAPVHDPTRTRLKLRADLRFIPQTVGGESCYTIEDPARSKFYHVGVAEYTLISLLDGDTPIRQALALAARTAAGAALTERDATAICKWLVDADLAAANDSAQTGRLIEAAEKNAADQFIQVCNPTMIRLPLVYPDRFFTVLHPWLSWLYSPAAAAAWGVLLVVALCRLAAQWDRFTDAAHGILSPGNWLWLALCWLVLKFLHEASHGAVCKRYGGTVREAGLMLILLAPVAYVDVTSSWRFSSKWQRIHTAAAGMYIELLVASIAAVVWSCSGDGPLAAFCHNAVWMAGLATVLFNANPLMKFDGYYMLSDWLEIPNLYANGQRYVRDVARRYLLGVGTLPPRTSGIERLVVPLYGAASLVCRLVFAVGLIVAASVSWRGAGIVLSCAAAVLWLGWPVARFVKYLIWGTDTERPNRIRFCCTAGLGAALLWMLLAALPWPGAVEAPVVVEFSPLAVVRTGCDGFIRRVFVQAGEPVREGQLLVQLENRELDRELEDLRLARELSQLKLRSLEQKGHIAAYQAELENLAAVTKRRQEKQSQVDQLVIRAPCAGTVIGQRLNSWEGRYAKAGSELLRIGNPAMLELRLSIAQEHVDAFAARLDRPVRVRMPGTAPFSCTLTQIHPRATASLPYAALAAPNRGPLAVRVVDTASDSDQRNANAEAFELLEPRFSGIAIPGSEHSRPLRAGQLGTASIRLSDESIGRYLLRRVSCWTERKLRVD